MPVEESAIFFFLY